jgi:hypothetical protein
VTVLGVTGHLVPLLRRHAQLACVRFVKVPAQLLAVPLEAVVQAAITPILGLIILDLSPATFASSWQVMCIQPGLC